MLDRLGIAHPETAGVRKCSCGEKMGTGRHALRCPQGGGLNIIHNDMRDIVADIHGNAGVTVGRETVRLLPGTVERPADVHVHGIGGQGRDIAIDVAVVDSQAGGSEAELQRRAFMTSLAARRREAQKRDARRVPGGPTMEERLRLRGMDCIPLIFEADGATTGTWARYLKKLSEIAHVRRGHNAKYFVAQWRTRVAMTLAKRGAQVAIRRSHAVQQQVEADSWGTDDDLHGYGPLGSFGVELPPELAADATAHITCNNSGGFFGA